MKESPLAPYARILVANRGEIALRVMRTCREKGIETVAVYSRVDGDSLHVEQADRACCVGEGEAGDSYMNIPNIICAALQLEADAIHPGYGFLSEDARFAEICVAHGISFIGPGPEALKLAGDKFLTREVASASGIPVLPASSGDLSMSNVRQEARKVGYPLILKPRSGGGGRGIMHSGDEEALERLLLDPAVRQCISRDGSLLERCLRDPRHIEVQLLADRTGNARVVGLRDCSVQMNQQKVVEEAPPTHLSRGMRHRLFEAALRLCRATRFTTAGTVEFLVSGDDFFFIELNPRIQVEHTVTEMLTGLDLVWEQIRLSAGDGLEEPGASATLSDSVNAREPRAWGHAIQARIYAEHPHDPSGLCTGVGALRFPGGPGVRVDTHIYPGCSVPYIYDPLLAKIVTLASTRAEAVKRMRRALDEVRIEGVPTNLPMLEAVIDSKEFRHGHYHTNLLERLRIRQGDEVPSPLTTGATLRSCEAHST